MVAVSQGIVRSITHRWWPRRWEDSMPLQAMRTSMPRSCTHCRSSAVSLPCRRAACRACVGVDRAATGRRDRFDQRPQPLGVIGVGGRNPYRQVDPRAVGQHVDLRAGLAAIDRARTGHSSPSFARTLAASITARDQSIEPRPPSSSSTALCRRRHKPASVHTLNRRCAVGTVTPNEGGSIRHAQPLVSTNTTAVNTARSSTGVVPPPCGRGVNSGSNGSTRATTHPGQDVSTTHRPRVEHRATQPIPAQRKRSRLRKTPS